MFYMVSKREDKRKGSKNAKALNPWEIKQETEAKTRILKKSDCIPKKN